MSIPSLLLSIVTIIDVCLMINFVFYSPPKPHLFQSGLGINEANIDLEINVDTQGYLVYMKL